MTPLPTNIGPRTINSAAHHSRVLGLLLTGALALSACGGLPSDNEETRSGDLAESTPTAASSTPSPLENDAEADETSPSSKSSSDEPGRVSTSDSKGTSESSSASPERTTQERPAPDTPGEITENSEDGARVAVEHWWELYAYARNTGNTDPLKKISSDNCSYCTDRITGTDIYYSQGGSWEQSPYAIASIGLSRQDDSTFTGGFTSNGGDFTVFDPEGGKKSINENSDQQWGATVIYDEGHWLIHDLTILSDDDTKDSGS